jgi:hypothetical protein
MKLFAAFAVSLALAACTTSSRPRPGGFLVYSFDYQTCEGVKVHPEYPDKTDTPNVRDPDLYGLEAFAEIRVDPTTGAVESARFLKGSKKLYESLADYPQRRSVKGGNAACLVARYRVLTFGEVVHEVGEHAKALKAQESQSTK